MFFPEIDYQVFVETSLETLDAEMSACAVLWRQKGPMLNRNEITPQRLIGYRVFSDYGTNLLGECGWINVQYVESKRTQLWFQITAPSDDDYENYVRYYQFSLPANAYELSAEELRAHRKTQLDGYLRLNRHRLLSEICEHVLRRLPKPELFPAPEISQDAKPSQHKGGRPGLLESEKLRRLALMLLERRLKQADPGLTRGEFVIRVQEKLRLPVEVHTIKNSASLLARAQENGEDDLLALAENQAAEWQKHFT